MKGEMLMMDSAIIGLFFSRSERAIPELDKKYGVACYRTANNILGNRQDAEECVNDAYLGVWNSIPPHDPDPLSAFVLRIVRNISLRRVQYNRAEKRTGNYQECYEELSECIADTITPETVYHARELTHYIEDYLDGLSRTNRLLFVRRYWFVDSIKGLAADTGLNEGAVRTRLSRMRQELKEMLQEKGVMV